MTFDNEFLLVHYPKKGSDYLYKKRVIVVRDLENVVGSYYANRVRLTADNFRMDWITVQCGKYGKMEIFRK